jgi:hypothetical protein
LALRARSPAEDNDPVRVSWGTGLLIALAASSIQAQSLAEVAKRERERRAEVGENGRTLSNKDLEEARGESVSISGSPAAPAEALPEPVTEGDSPWTSKEIADLRVQWTRIWEGQMAQAEADLAKARDDRYQCQAAERYFFVPLAVDCDGVELRLAAAEARYRRVKANRFHWELLLPENRDP